MYTVSNEFKEIVKSNAVAATARITLVADGTVLDGNNLSSVSIKDYCNNNGTIIGTTMCKEAEIEIINNGYDLADKEFLLEVGVELADGTIEYIPYGNYTVKEYTDMKSNNKYKIVAYDYMDKLNKQFTDNNTYPMTLQAFYEALATQYDVQIEEQVLPNQEFIIEEKPFFEGSTGRTVLSAIAQMFGSFAKFNRNNKLQMYLKNETGEQIARDQMNSKLEIDNRYGPLNTVVLSLGNVEGENVTLKSEELINSPSGKNIANISRVAGAYTQTLENGVVTINGNYSGLGNVAMYFDNDSVVLKANETYTISVICTGEVRSPGYKVCYLGRKQLGGISIGNLDNNHTIVYTYTPEQDVIIPYISFDLATNTTFANYQVKIQIEKNSTRTEYEPFKPVGEVTLEIVDNPFVYTEELRSKAIQGIYDRVLGFTYIPTSFNYKAYLYLDCGDAVQVQQMKTDDYVDTIILNQEIKVPATRKSKCTNTALTKTQVQNQYVSPEKQAQRKTEIMVDKQNGTIEAISASVSQNSSQIAQLVIEDSKISQRVSSTEERIGTAEEDIEEANRAIDGLGDRITDEVANLQGQIDGAIQFWNGSDIPTLNNEPAINWATEEDRNNHRADIYTVIEDVDGELKQGKSYRFDKVGISWTWVELTDNELSAVQALAASKAKVFVTQPKVPYNVGDLWLKDKELYECVTAKDTNGSFALIDWQKATKYTDDTIALLAQQAADKAIDNQTTTNTTEEAKTFYLPDSADSNCKSAEIFGESTQETRSGYNLFNIDSGTSVNGATKIVNGNEATITGINGYASYYWEFDVSSINTICISGEIVSGTYARVLIQKDGSTIYAADDIGVFSKTIDTSSTTTLTVYLYANKGASLESDTSSVYKEIMVSTIEAEYEEYGNSPSPEFPSEIESVSGKNKLDVSVVENKYIRPDGFMGTSSLSKLTDYIPVKANKTYVFSYDYETLANTAERGICLFDINKEFISGGFNYYPTKTKSVLITPTEDGYVRIAYDINCIDLQFEQNTRPTFYVPYNHIGFKSVGKNKFGIYNCELNPSWNNVNPILDIIDSNNFTMNCKVDSDWQGLLCNNLVPNKKYVVQFEVTLLSVLSETDNQAYRICISYNKQNNNQYILTLNQKFKITRTIEAVNGYIYIGSHYNTVKFENVIIREENTTENYEPYKESITAIPLLHPLRSLPNGTRDRIYESNGKWYDEQRIGRVVLNGSENWIMETLVNDNSNNFYVHIPDAYAYRYNPIIVSHFKYSYHLNAEFTSYISNYGNLNLYYPSMASLEEFKSWLSDNNVEVIYELAEPIVTEIIDGTTITALESIKTFKNITSITADAPSILTYYRDVPLNYEYQTQQAAQKQYKITEERFANQEITDDQIKATVQSLTTKVTEEYATKTELSTQITQTDKKIEVEINKSIQDLKDNGVPKVISKIVTIDDRGLTVGASDSEFTNTMDNTGNYQYNAGTLVAKYDKDGADIPRLKSDLAIVAGIKYTKETIGEIVHHKQYVIE